MSDPVVLEIHTSDRGTFKRCRRRFGWGSTLRDNLVRIGPDHKAFFVGTGFHFAMEDFHGYRKFDHPALAFAAYYDAQNEDDLPEDADESLDLAFGMLSYYADDWLADHPEKYRTLWINGVPQVEVEVGVDITDLLLERAEYEDRRQWLEELLVWYGEGKGGPSGAGARVHYVCTFDRVVQDAHDRIAVLDYKTAGSFDELNLQTNPQAGSYDWAADLFYTPVGYKPVGLIWQQHKKAVPQPPRKLKDKDTKKDGLVDKGFTKDRSFSTTHRLYRNALIAHYGKVPPEYIEHLNFLAELQDEDGDNFVRRDMIRRNDVQREVEQAKIVAEVLEMLDPGLPLYPNPTKECSWDCPFKVPCLAMDDGSDVQFLLKLEFAKWDGYRDDWRKRIKWPKGPGTGVPEDSPIEFALP